MHRLAITALLLLLPGCAAAPNPIRHEFTRLCMGVPTRVALYADSPEVARDAAAAAFGRIAELEQIMSDYRPDSELMRLCAAPPGVPHPVSPDLQGVLTIAQEVSEATEGAFDITSGPMVALWRRCRDTGTLPTDAELEAARVLVGPGLLTLDQAAHTATLARPDMKLDLGGIGKGYAAQAAVDHLRAGGHPRCLVALAGDIATGDRPPGSHGWTIALPDGRSIPLANLAISTSGGAEQSVEIGGVRYAHIIDPRTGLGLSTSPSATVIAPRGELADALSTAACILGPDRIRPILRQFHCSMP